MHISTGLPDPLTSKWQLTLALRGMHRMQPRTQDTRLPVTPLILDLILRVIQCNPASYTNIMMWAACCLGYFAFLRSGEFTVNEPFDQSRHLGVGDVAVDSHENPSMLSIKLKRSKTDQEGIGVVVYVGRTYTPTCPVSAILSFLVVRRPPSDAGPLFRCADGSALTRPKLVTWLKSTLEMAGVDPTHFSGHSFRIGAATTASARGIPDSTIQTMGRWARDSFKRYIRIPRQNWAQMSRVLA